MSPVASNCSLCEEDGGMLIWRSPSLRIVAVDDLDLPGYTRVIWHKHVPEMSDLSAAEQQELMQVVMLVESAQRRILAADKVNLASLGNMTPHLHWHVIPRWRDDAWFPDSIWAQPRERDQADRTSWRERHEALSALQGEYAAALRVSLDRAFNITQDSPASVPAQAQPARTSTEPVDMSRRSSAPRDTLRSDPAAKRPARAGAASNQLHELPGRQLAGLHPGWRAALETPEARNALARLDEFLEQRLREGAVIYPARVFRALEELSPEDVRVVILGQDPYHGPGQAQGLAFSVPDSCPAPPSLRNIFNELAQEYPDLPPRRSNDLSDWSRQGVLLLNTSLTVEQGAAGSHARKGWEAVTDALIDVVAAAPYPKAFLLWGNHAQSKQAAIEAKGASCRIFKANHPSPLSALRPPRPFIGCGHFLQANTWLSAQGQQPIDWM